MKKIGILLLIMCLFLQYSPLLAYASDVSSTTETTLIAVEEDTQSNSAVTSGSFSLDASIPMLVTDKLVDNVRSAVVYEVNSQTLMYAWNPDVQMYPASLVKIMTALIAVEKGNMEEIVTVSQGALSAVASDAVSAKLIADEKITLEDLLYCLLLGSANDAAAVIAEYISGSQGAFVDVMNQYAQEIGCSATHFTNPHGLHDDNQHTTARDSAKILEHALKNPLFKAFFTATERTVTATNLSPERRLVTGNSMMDTSSQLYYDSRVIGGRTGVTQDGRRCLAAAAEANGMLVISIVMGAESVYQEDGYSAISIGGYKETTSLYNACLDGYKAAQVLRSEQILRQVQINDAQNDLLLAPQKSVYTVLPLDITADQLTMRYFDKPISLPITKGQHVSDVQIWHGATCVAQVELYAMNSLYATETDTDENTGAGKAYNPVWIILVVVIVTAGIFVYLRFSTRIKSYIDRKRRNRYRKSHKRIR